MKGKTAEYLAGRRSRNLNIPRDNNPYHPGTARHAQWRSGWDSVFKGAGRKKKSI